jgi:hypothetical protein
MIWLPLLLADTSPCLRLLVLKELLERPDDDSEIQELLKLREKDPLVSQLFTTQSPDGSWELNDIGGRGSKNKILSTSYALKRLGYLNFGKKHPKIQKAAEFIFSYQQENGSWPLYKQYVEKEGSSKYSMIPLQTALPLQGLMMCGYASDKRVEQAFNWLFEQQLEDGGWPAGLASGNYGYIAGYRKLPHSRWGCRSNTTGVLQCLSYHPKYKNSSQTQRAFDLLLSRETRETHTLGFEMARLIGIEPNQGFFTRYARFDLVLILNLCWQIGVSQEDERVANLIDFFTSQQGQYGLWQYIPHPQANRWITFDILRALKNIDKNSDWFSMEPRTSFQAYPSKQKRF